MSIECRFDGYLRALRLYNRHELREAEEECTKLLAKNPLDQAAWSLKLACLTEPTFIDELESEDIGIAETYLDSNVIAPNSRPGTSFQRPMTTSKGSNPLLRPMSNSGRPITGVTRPSTTARPGTMEQAMRTSRTAKTARAMSSSSARSLRLGTASMASGNDGQFVNLGRLNIEKYAADPMVNRHLFEYVFYHEGNFQVAHQIAAAATKAAEFKDWYWKNQLGKCYMRMGLYDEAEKQFESSLKNSLTVETFAYLAKIYCRRDQPLPAIKHYENGLLVFRDDVTLLTGLARAREQLGELEESVRIYKQLLQNQSNNIEAIACVATSYYYNDRPEIALRYYRRIMQMGVSNAELFMNIGLCCFACQQYDFSISSIQRAVGISNDQCAGDIWYNIGCIMQEMGDCKMAARCYQLAITADSQHAESLTNLGVLKHREGKREQAKSMFTQAMRKAPHLFEPHFNMCLLLFEDGKYHDCRQLLLRTLDIFPNHVPTINMFQQIENLYKNV